MKHYKLKALDIIWVKRSDQRAGKNMFKARINLRIGNQCRPIRRMTRYIRKNRLCSSPVRLMPYR